LTPNETTKTTPATEGQLKESLQRAQNLKSLIETECLAEGFLACSGNGFHLFFPLPRFELLGEGFRRKINHKVKLFAKKSPPKLTHKSTAHTTYVESQP